MDKNVVPLNICDDYAYCYRAPNNQMSNGGIFVTPGNLSYSPPNPNFILSDFFGRRSSENNPPQQSGRNILGAPLSSLVISWTLKPGGTDGKLYIIFPRASAPKPPLPSVAPPSSVWDNHTRNEHSSPPNPWRCQQFDGYAAEFRLERMIRNWAAAERTRARRTAYDSHVRAEITVLREENKELKQKEKELRKALEAAHPLYHKIRRSLSAAFKGV